MKEKPSSGIKQFLLTLLATTFSIILTFGTSAIIERRHKAAAKKEMAMMIIYDFLLQYRDVQHTRQCQFCPRGFGILQYASFLPGNCIGCVHRRNLNRKNRRLNK